MAPVLPNFAGFTISRGPFHLRLLEQIGSGASGVVHLAKDISRCVHGAKYYAVKCLPTHPYGSRLAHEQHRQVAHHRAVSAHPNVVTLHATIEEEFYTFLVLDLVAGGDLFASITERNTYADNDAAVKRSFLQLIDAVAACHAKGIAHRDLKLENILCSGDGEQIYLTDFGLSTHIKRSTEFGCGSSSYMSPECLGISKKKTTPSYLTMPSDVWALGNILCNLLTGRNPWHLASRASDQGFRHYLREGPSWLLNKLAISPAAAAILGRIFVVDPAARITLPELRAAVLSADSFFPAATSAARGPYTLGPIPASTFEIDFDRTSEPLDAPVREVPVAGAPALVVSHQSSESGQDSDGPSTPETHPVDVDGANILTVFSLDETVSEPSQEHRERKMGNLKIFTRSLGMFIRARAARS